MITPSNTDSIIKAGDINERGYLAGFSRRGFTNYKSYNEILANSSDSFDNMRDAGLSPMIPTKKIINIITREKTKLIDNAMGMDDNDAKKMASLHNENHRGRSRRGVSGIGAKPSMSKLSNKQTVETHTRKFGAQNGWVINWPWGVIHNKGCYTCMVEIRMMNPEEETEFYKDREDNGMLTTTGEAYGTTHNFPTNNNLSDVIRCNFAQFIDSGMNVLDRAGVIFGRENVEIILNDYEQGNKMMQMYNYFGGNQADYYKGINEEQVEQWYSKEKDEDRFIWRKDDEVYEIQKSGKGCSKDAKSIKVNTLGYEYVGSYNVYTALRFDKNVFDPEHPVPITAESVESKYNQEHINNDETFSGSIRLVRNNQIIGLIPTPDITIAAAKRGTGESNFKYLIVQSEVSFNPPSTQKDEENHQDRVMNIQENKNQFDGNSLPLTFTRLIKSIKVQKANEIWNYFQSILEAKESTTIKKVGEMKAAREAEEKKKADLKKAEEKKEAELKKAEEEATEVTTEEDVDNNESESVSESESEEETEQENVQEKQEEETEQENVQEKQEEETEQEVKSDNEKDKPAPPCDVSGYRKNGAYGYELEQELNRVKALITDKNSIYSQCCWTDLLNNLKRIK